MPAIEHSFADFPPLHICLDTNFVLDYLVNARPRHKPVVNFLANIQQSITTTFYVSSILWPELVHSICREDFHSALSEQYRDQYQLDRWADDPAVRSRYVLGHVAALDGMLSQVNRVEVGINAVVRQQAVALMVRFNLGSQDAIHLACAQVAGVHDLASFDRHFRRVDGLHLWNDKIFGEQPYP